MSETEQEQRRVQVNWVKAVAGGLAAMSSAVLLSTVGVAGTVVGAALGSVIIAIGSEVYSHYLALSRERVAAARAQALARAYRARARGHAGAEGATATATLVEADASDEQRPDAEDTAVAPVHPERVSWRDTVKGLPWKRIAPIAAAVFLAVMGVILAFELMTGRTVSSFTGGADADGPRTSLSVFSGGGGDTRQEDAPGGGSSGEQRITERDGTGDGGGSEEEPAPDTGTEAPAEEEDEAPEPTVAPTTEAPEPTQEPEPTTAPTPTQPPATSASPAAGPLPGGAGPGAESTP